MKAPMKAEAIEKRNSNNRCWHTSPTQLGGLGSDEKAGDTFVEDQECVKEMKELHAYLDMVAEVVRPGSSHEMLKFALNSMVSLFNALTIMSSTPRPYASL